MKLWTSFVVAALTLATCYASDTLPEAVTKAGIPATQIVDVTAKIYGPIRPDKDSPTGKAAVFTPKKALTVFGVGVFDPALWKTRKKVVGYTKCTVADERYHWYQVRWQAKSSDGVIGENSSIYLGDWSIGVRLGKLTGQYDYWVYVKAQGPLCKAGSTKESGLFLSRAILVKRP